MLYLIYRFEDDFFDYSIEETRVVEDIIEYLDRFQSVNVDGTPSAVWNALLSLGVDFNDLIEDGDIADFIKNKHSEEAREEYEGELKELEEDLDTVKSFRLNLNQKEKADMLLKDKIRYGKEYKTSDEWLLLKHSPSGKWELLIRNEPRCDLSSQEALSILKEK